MPPEADCRRCRLGEGRTNLVLFCGDPSSKVALVGEAPGAQDVKDLLRAIRHG